MVWLDTGQMIVKHVNASSNWDMALVAGIAGAETNNIGVSSIGNGISIMALKAANASGSSSNTWDIDYTMPV